MTGKWRLYKRFILWLERKAKEERDRNRQALKDRLFHNVNGGKGLK